MCAGCGSCSIPTKSYVATANHFVVDAVGLSTFSGKKSMVYVVLMPFVSG